MAILLNNLGQPYDDNTGKFVSWKRARKSSIFREALSGIERDTYLEEEDEERFIQEQIEAEEIESGIERDIYLEEEEEDQFIEEQLEAEKLFFPEEVIDEDEIFIQEQIEAERLELGIPPKPVKEWDFFIDIWDAYITEFDLDEDDIGVS